MLLRQTSDLYRLLNFCDDLEREKATPGRVAAFDLGFARNTPPPLYTKGTAPCADNARELSLIFSFIRFSCRP